MLTDMVMVTGMVDDTELVGTADMAHTEEVTGDTVINLDLRSLHAKKFPRSFSLINILKTEMHVH